MKAIVSTRYGGPEVLGLEDVAVPSIDTDKVLIRVHATSVNPFEMHLMRGDPFLVRLSGGLRRPKQTVLGVDCAGVIEAVGPDVTNLHVGDEVVGGCTGAFAELAVGSGRLVRKPAALSFEDAAALPIAGCTALQGLRDVGHLTSGQHVLVNGAGGGVGTFAVQIAVALGAEVTAVCSASKATLVTSLGATHVVDYATDDFASGTTHYDVILDCVGNRSVQAFRRALTPKGRLVLVGGGGGRWLGPLAMPLRAMAMSPFVGQTMKFCMAQLQPDDLDILTGMVVDGSVRPVLGRTMSLSDAPAAIADLEAGHAVGKTVLRVLS